MRLEEYQAITPTIANGDYGLTYKFNKSLEQHGISLSTPVCEIAEALAYLTEPDVNEQTPVVLSAQGKWTDDGIRSRTSCNGVHHALIVANFSKIVAKAMLLNDSTRDIINTEIYDLPEEACTFLCKDQYSNYIKIVEIMALFHDIGRPQDGIDRWDEYNAINVISVMPHFLAGLDSQTRDAIMSVVETGIKGRDKGWQTSSRLFGYPVKAGDALHSGHAFHGGAWDDRDFNPQYVKVFSECEQFQANFSTIQQDVRQFVPVPEGRFDSIEQYATNIFETVDGGPAMLKTDFAKIITEQFSQMSEDEYPAFARYTNNWINEMTAERPQPRGIIQHPGVKLVVNSHLADRRKILESYFKNEDTRNEGLFHRDKLQMLQAYEGLVDYEMDRKSGCISGVFGNGLGVAKHKKLAAVKSLINSATNEDSVKHKRSYNQGLLKKIKEINVRHTEASNHNANQAP